MPIVIAQKFHNGIPIFNETAFNEYREQTEGYLVAIRKTAMGNSLLEAIEKTGRTVEIRKIAGGVSGAQKAGNNCCIAGDSTPAYYNPLSLEVERGKTHLQKVLDRSRERKFLPAVAIAKLVGIGEVDLQAMAGGTKQIPENIGYKLQIYLEDCLMPGDGKDCVINFDPNSAVIDCCGGSSQKIVDVWKSRPPAIGLAHELIHAWRFVTGRCIFKENEDGSTAWEDEAMTVGLPPFTQRAFTENIFRVQWKQLYPEDRMDIRPEYANLRPVSDFIRPTNVPQDPLTIPARQK